MNTTLRGWFSRHWRYVSIAWYVLTAGLGVAALAVRMFSLHWYLILVPLPLGAGIGLAVSAAVEHVWTLCREKFEGMLPRSIHRIDGGTDGPTVLVVTRQNGEMVTIREIVHRDDRHSEELLVLGQGRVGEGQPEPTRHPARPASFCRPR